MDMNAFKKISEDHKSVTLAHPDGHKFVLRKDRLANEHSAALSKMPFENVKGYWDGGLSEADKSRLSDSLPAGDSYQAPDNSPKAVQQEQYNQQLQDSLGPADPNVAAQMAGDKNGSIPSGVNNVDLGTGSPNAPPGGGGDPDFPMPDVKSVSAGYDTEKRGIKDYYDQMGQAQTAMVPEYQHHSNVLQGVATQTQENALIHHQEMQKLMDDINNHKIEPNAYINSMNTPQKVTTAIGLILGGMGAGITHGSNPAMDYLQSQIDRDVSAQKFDKEKKMNLLNAMEKVYGDDQDALKMTEAFYASKMENDIKKEMATRGDALSQARGRMLLGPVMQRKNQAILEVSRNQALMKAMNSGNPEQTLNALRVFNPPLAKDMESRYIPGVGTGSVPITPENRDKITAGIDLNNKLQKLEEFATKHQGTVLARDVVNQGQTLAADAQNAARQAAHAGVYKEGEAKFLNSMIDPDPTKFLANYRTIPKYKALRESNTQTINGLLKAHGFKGSLPTFNTRQGK